ncbi:hypothetical protein [Candidatus Parabeggiatoa sp. HSG14]|uniref:hypothetical protein n=1 Tax=Candidatus Parabeggiatoa sp. HSG14 TaxID=3055593 RepID=UPI0025A803E6|nr:hypothetical protein [Thiotrichales bacterium HSG14]
MSQMGKYCKAYLAERFREFPNWTENLQNLRIDKKTEDGREIDIERTKLKDNDILYLQENYVVTDGVFKDENIIFDTVNDEWKAFCKDTLEFEIPTYEPIEIKESETTS